MRIEAKLEDVGLMLLSPALLPPGVPLSFAWVWARGDRVYVSGHGSRHGQCGPGFQGDDRHHQRLLGSDPGALRPEAGMHARAAVGMAALPLGLPVTIAAEVEIQN